MFIVYLRTSQGQVRQVTIDHDMSALFLYLCISEALLLQLQAELPFLLFLLGLKGSKNQVEHGIEWLEHCLTIWYQSVA